MTNSSLSLSLQTTIRTTIAGKILHIRSKDLVMAVIMEELQKSKVYIISPISVLGLGTKSLYESLSNCMTRNEYLYNSEALKF